MKYITYYNMCNIQLQESGEISTDTQFLSRYVNYTKSLHWLPVRFLS